MIDKIFSYLEAKYKRFDIRFKTRKSLTIELKKGKIEKLVETRSAGYSVRAVENGKIGYVFLAGEKPEPKDIKFKIKLPWIKTLDLKPTATIKDKVYITATKPLENISVDGKISFLRDLDRILVEAGIWWRRV